MRHLLLPIAMLIGCFCWGQAVSRTDSLSVKWKDASKAKRGDNFTIITKKEPPGYYEIMKWYFSGFPKNHNGWGIEFQEMFYVYGYTEGIRLDRISFTCDTCWYFRKYTYDVVFAYGLSDTTELKVIYNRDTLNKYSKLNQ